MLQLGGNSALNSAFQEAVHEISVHWMCAALVRKEFCSQLCIPGSCAWYFCSLNVCCFSQEGIPLSVVHSRKLCVIFLFVECMLL
jgi:hypothetical protein